MTRLVALLLALGACAEVGPEHARLLSLRVYSCANPCGEYARTLGPAIDRPPNDGSWFYLRASAPGALMLQQFLYAPDAVSNEGWVFTGIPEKADTLGTWWATAPGMTHVKWKVTLPWVGDRLLDADSLVWDWP